MSAHGKVLSLVPPGGYVHSARLPNDGSNAKVISRAAESMAIIAALKIRPSAKRRDKPLIESPVVKERSISRVAPR